MTSSCPLIFSIICLSAITAPVFAQPKAEKKVKTPLQKAFLLGKVKSVTQTTYEVKITGGVAEKANLISKQTYMYDVAGNQTEYHSNTVGSKYYNKEIYQFDNRSNETEFKKYNTDGSLDYMKTKKYDANNNMIEEGRSEKPGTYKWLATYTYDNKGNKTSKIVNTIADNTSTKTTFSYDGNGNLIEEIFTQEDGIRKTKTNYQYNAANLLTERKFSVSNSAGEFNESEGSKVFFVYNDKGQKIQMSDNGSNLIGYIKHTYKYDLHGNQIEDNELSQKKKNRTTKVYDNLGKVLESGYYDENSILKEKYVYAYNEKGETIIYARYITGDVAAFKFIYEYKNLDSKGNWLRKNESKNGEPSAIIEREIVYH